MKNLEKFGVKKLEINEQIKIQGGWNIFEGIGYLVGSAVGVALVTVKLVAENLGSFRK